MDAEASSWRKTMGSVDGLVLNVGVRGRVMVKGVFSSVEDAKKTRDMRIEIERSKEGEEAMAVLL